MKSCWTCGEPIERIGDQCNLSAVKSYHRGQCCPGCRQNVESYPRQTLEQREAQRRAARIQRLQLELATQGLES